MTQHCKFTAAPGCDTPGSRQTAPDAVARHQENHGASMDPRRDWYNHMEAFKKIIESYYDPSHPVTITALNVARYHLASMERLSRQMIDAPQSTSNLATIKQEADSDVLRTDSGYYSAGQAGRQPLVPDADEFDTTIQARKDDSMTVLSALTDDLPVAARHTIVEVCETISRQIRDQARAAGRESFLSALPGNIKSFAIRFGLDNNHRLNRTIMSFIYAHQREIVAILSSFIFDHEDDDELQLSKSRQVQGMSVDDKMLLWGARSQDHPRDPETSDQFVGVGEDDNETVVATDSDLSLYSQTILSSQPYQWLVGSLLRESRFHWDDKQPRTMMEEVRQKVVVELPTGTISSKKDLDSHQVTFQLNCRALLERLGFEQSTRGVGLRDGLFDSIVLTSSSPHEIQATTVQEYLVQTWGDSGTDILNTLEEVIQGKSTSASKDIHSAGNIRQIHAGIDEKKKLLSISATGPACLLGERAEQLAWLGAALQRSPKYKWLAIHAKPLAKKTQCEGEGTKSWILTHENETKAPERALSLFSNWMGQPACRVIARGYPTARRPNLCPGIEIPASISPHFFTLADFEPSYTLTIILGTVLNGSPGTLKLVKIAGEVFVWHVFQLRVPDFCSCKDKLFRTGDTKEASVTIDSLNQSRHILGDCETTMAWLESQTPPTPPISQSTGSRQDTSSDADTRSISSLSVHTAIHCKDGESAGESEYGASTVQGGSHETSLDSDMLSISDESNYSWRKLSDVFGDLNLVVEAVARRLYCEFRSKSFQRHHSDESKNTHSQILAQENVFGETASLREGFRTLRLHCGGVNIETPGRTATSHTVDHQQQNSDAPGDSPEGGGGTSGRPDCVRSTQRDRTSSAKKGGSKGQQRNDQRDGNGDEDRDSPFPRKRTKRGRPDNAPNVLACPFWKRDPVKHRSCFKSELYAVNRVKQHLTRKHTPTYYCERCKVIFPDEESHRQHLQQPCVLDEDATLDGVTHQQHRQLTRRSNPALSEEEQWFTIWEQLFPGQSRPGSPYLDPSLSEDLCHYREYIRRSGPGALTQELQKRGILLSLQHDHQDSGTNDTVQEDAIRQAMQISFDMLFDDWLSSRSNGSDVSPGSSESRDSLPLAKRQRMPRPQRPPTPSGSFADSGVSSLHYSTTKLQKRPQRDVFSTIATDGPRRDFGDNMSTREERPTKRTTGHDEFYSTNLPDYSSHPIFGSSEFQMDEQYEGLDRIMLSFDAPSNSICMGSNNFGFSSGVVDGTMIESVLQLDRDPIRSSEGAKSPGKGNDKELEAEGQDNGIVAC